MTTKAILSFFWEVTPLNPWTVSYIYTAEALLSQCNRWSMGTSTITPSLGHAKIKCTGQMRNTLKHLATRLHQMKRVKGNSYKAFKTHIRLAFETNASLYKIFESCLLQLDTIKRYWLWHIAKKCNSVFILVKIDSNTRFDILCLVTM